MSKALLAIGILAALVPSGMLAWKARAMPHLGYFQDDALYWIGAKSIAEGHGYRILSLPGEPFQTKYPPLYPLVLSVIWKLRPGFPANLPVAAALNWLMLPAYLLAAWKLTRALGLEQRRRVILLFALALSPTAAFMAANMMADLMSAALVLFALALAERVRDGRAGAMMALAAGIVGGGAFLAKTSALPLLVTVPALLLWRGRKRLREACVLALCFAAPMLAATAAWNYWTHIHRMGSTDPLVLYYTDYLGLYLHNLAWSDLPKVIQTNCRVLLNAIGELIVFHPGSGVFFNFLLMALGLFSVSGVIRWIRTKGLSQYAAFAPAYAAELVVWHYPPNTRFLLPLIPLFLIGAIVECEHLYDLGRKAVGSADRSQRAAGAVVFALLGVLVVSFWGTAAYGLVRFVPAIIDGSQPVMDGTRPAFDWIRGHVAGDAKFLAYADTPLFLYTGRQGYRLEPAVRPYYYQDHAAILKPFSEIPAIAGRRHLRYLLLTITDYQTDSVLSDHALVRSIVRRDPRMRLIFANSTADVYEIE
jgi:hypothetical protein